MKHIITFCFLAALSAACDDSGEDDLATCEEYGEKMVECGAFDDWTDNDTAACKTNEGLELYQCRLGCDLNLDCGDYQSCQCNCGGSEC